MTDKQLQDKLRIELIGRGHAELPAFLEALPRDSGWPPNTVLSLTDREPTEFERAERYVAAFTPDVVRATCDDYRAGATIDVELDRADRDGGRRIACPVLALWGDPSNKRPSLIDVWQRWADDVQGRAIRCGHFLAEEAPAETLAALDAFLDRA